MRPGSSGSRTFTSKSRRPIRLVVASEIRLYREGITHILDLQPGIVVLGTAHDTRSAVSTALELLPDIVLLDMAMNGASSAVRALAEGVPDVHVVGLAVPETESQILECAEAGLAAFVLREASFKDLVATLESVTLGEFPCSPKVAASLVRRLASLSAERGAGVALGRLTQREAEIVRLIDQGLTNKEIARRLSIQLSTVKNHVHNILEKLQLRRRAHAAAAVAGRRELLPG